MFTSIAKEANHSLKEFLGEIYDGDKTSVILMDSVYSNSLVRIMEKKTNTILIECTISILMDGELSIKFMKPVDKVLHLKEQVSEFYWYESSTIKGLTYDMLLKHRKRIVNQLSKLFSHSLKGVAK